MRKTNGKSKNMRVKPELAGGFRDYGPADAMARARMVEAIRKTFEDFGFEPMETPAVERTEVLLGGEKESGKIIFNVSGSREKKSDLSLRFDLTVPLARFLAANPDIPKPFRRYQMGQVFRGESPQAGRYREFLQADIDIAGSATSDADAEVIAAIATTLKNLGISKFTLKLNSRKILNGLPAYAGFPAGKLPDLLRIIDKKEKIGDTACAAEMKKVVKGPAAGKVIACIGISGDARAKISRAREMFKGIAIAEEGIKDLVEIIRDLNASGVSEKNWEIDFSVARGLGYYTGSVFETVLGDAPEIGSIASGGRYDELMVPFTGQKLPTVGGSIGIDRLFAALEKLGAIKKKLTSVKVLILNLSPELKNEYFAFAARLRGENINTVLYLGDDRAFGAQLAYAVKKEIPFVLIFGDNENKKGTVTIKNLVTREQKEMPKDRVTEYFRR